MSTARSRNKFYLPMIFVLAGSVYWLSAVVLVFCVLAIWQMNWQYLAGIITPMMGIAVFSYMLYKTTQEMEKEAAFGRG